MPTTLNTQGTITTSTGTVTLSGLTGTNRIMCGVYAAQGQTYSGASVVVEGSNDGTNYVVIPLLRMDTGVMEANVVQLNTSECRGWESQQSGTWSKVRVRATALSAGTISVGIATSADPTRTVTKTPAAEVLQSTGGRYKTYLAAAAGTPSVVMSSQARLCKVIVLSSGSAATTVYDNAAAASGDKVLVVPANPTIGAVYDVQVPCVNGITVDQTTNTSAICLTYLPLQ